MSGACDHGMPSPASCIECMAEGNLEPAPRPKAERVEGSTFPARYPGHCPGCNLPIVEGQHIGRTNRDRYVHADCTGGAAS